MTKGKKLLESAKKNLIRFYLTTGAVLFLATQVLASACSGGCSTVMSEHSGSSYIPESEVLTGAGYSAALV